MKCRQFILVLHISAKSSDGESKKQADKQMHWLMQHNLHDQREVAFTCIT